MKYFFYSVYKEGFYVDGAFLLIIYWEYADIFIPCLRLRLK